MAEGRKRKRKSSAKILTEKDRERSRERNRKEWAFRKAISDYAKEHNVSYQEAHKIVARPKPHPTKTKMQLRNEQRIAEGRDITWNWIYRSNTGTKNKISRDEGCIDSGAVFAGVNTNNLE